jgi:hypothetical protein
MAEPIYASPQSTATLQEMNAGAFVSIQKSTQLAQIPEIWMAVKIL